MGVEPKAALTPEQVSWIGVRFGDPVGKVFQYDGNYYRAIYPEQQAHIDDLFDSGIIPQLCNRGLIVQTGRTGLTMAGFQCVLEHKTARYQLLGLNYCSEMLRDAAICWLDINLALVEHRLGLIDAHFGNFVITAASRPTWCDIGSIQPLASVNQGTRELLTYFVNPLRLLAKSPELVDLVHRLGNDGISNRELKSMLAPSQRLKLKVRGKAQRLREKAVRILSAKPQDEISFRRKQRLLDLKRELASLEWKSKSTLWSDYTNLTSLDGVCRATPELKDPSHHSNRLAHFIRVIEQLRPKTAIDLGANAGYFSLPLAVRGCEVLAIDSDDAALSRLRRFLKESNLDVKMAIVLRDVLTDSTQYQSDLVCAMALTHHLLISQRFPIDFIASRFAEFTSNTLITEFMPNGLGGTKPMPQPLPKQYRLDVFVHAFQRHFQQVEVLDYNMPASVSKRIMIVCRGKK